MRKSIFVLLLAAVAARVVAFEVDRGLCRYLEESLGDLPSVFLVQGDPRLIVRQHKEVPLLSIAQPAA